MHDWELCAAAVDAADEILSSIYGVEIRKSLDPLDPHDFAILCRSLSLQLKGHAIPAERDAVKKAMSTLDASWTDMVPEARGKLLSTAAGYLGTRLANEMLPSIEQTLSFAAKEIIPATKSKSVLTHELNISPSLNTTDQRIADYALVSQGHFIRDQYGQRADNFSEKARQIVSRGLERGLGSSDIASDLHAALNDHVDRGRHYWDIIAMVYANRARTMTQLAAFSEAGIEDYRWESVMDQVTSVQCRFLHGQRFPVAHAMRKFQEVEDAKSPEAIKTIQPFMQLGVDEGGSQHLYYKNAQGARVTVAHVEENAMGRADVKGKFSGALDAGELMKAGIHAPPIHGSCRSTIQPEFGSSSESPRTISVPSAPAPAASVKPPLRPYLFDVPPPPPPAPLPADAPNPNYAEAQERLKGLPGPPKDPQNLVETSGFFDFIPKTKLQKPSEKYMRPVQEKSEVAIDTLIPTVENLDRLAVKNFLSKIAYDPNYFPKLKSEIPNVLLKDGKHYVLSGHEYLAAKALLGDKTAQTMFVDASKVVVPEIEAPFPGSNGLLDHLPVKALPLDHEVPDGEHDHDFRRLAEQRVEGTEDAQEGVKKFTGNIYTMIRSVELDEEKAKQEYDASSIRRAKELSKSIDQFFQLAQPTEHVAFRGITDLSDARMKDFLTQDHFRLGATTSSSRTPSVAYSFAELRYNTANRIVLILKQRSGVAVETISSVPHENEILLPRHATFKITARYRATIENKDFPNALVIEAEEIDPRDVTKRAARVR